MTSRADYRIDFRDRLLPRVLAAAESNGFAPIRSPGTRQWRWIRPGAESGRAEILLTEATGRDVRGGLDIQAYGSIYLDEVENRLREIGPRHRDAATLTAPLRAWGATFTRDSGYPLRWNADPDARIDALIRDIRSFATFARAVRDVTDLSSARLARSRIRKHVTAGLAPNYTTAQVADLIVEMTSRADDER